MLLSTVRSKPLQEIRVGGDSSEEKKNADIGWIMKNLGFVRDSHQICVGITRCKYGLVIVGRFYIPNFYCQSCHKKISCMQVIKLCYPTVMFGVGLLNTIEIMIAL